jgi:broad specificity phosphatase PhoE
LAALVVRVGGWLDALRPGVRAVAFCPALVVRAAVVHALDLPATAIRRIEVAPLSVTRLRGRAGAWSLYLPPLR